jgi:hypothetical protein
MTDTDIIHIVLTSSFTTAELRRRLSLARSYLETRLFKPGETVPLNEYLTAQKADPSDVKIMTDWGSDFWNYFTKENTYKVLDKINAEFKKIPVIKIYVPYDADSPEMAKLGTWMRQNIDKTMLVDVRKDETTLGGCSVARNGEYRDFSLRYHLINKRSQIADIITKYTEKIQT